MTRRTLLALLLALATIGWPLSVRADDEGEDDDSGSDDGDDSDEGENEGEDDEDDDDKPEDGKGPPANQGTAGGDDHDEALRAVMARNAIPLKQILELFESQFKGTVIDVALIRGADELRYRVKFIDREGRVRRAYFDALSGQLVR